MRSNFAAAGKPTSSTTRAVSRRAASPEGPRIRTLVSTLDRDQRPGRDPVHTFDRQLNLRRHGPASQVRFRDRHSQAARTSATECSIEIRATFPALIVMGTPLPSRRTPACGYPR